MNRWRCIGVMLLFTINIVSPTWAETSAPLSEIPPDFKIAFIGDQGLGKDAEAVLRLIKAEGTQAVLYQGDFEGKNNLAAWDAQINKILDADFPYFVSIGNHDVTKWDGENGYQYYFQNRLNRLGIAWDGDLGIQSSIRYKGILIILVVPGIKGSEHDVYVRNQLAADKSIWRICSWHKNMRLMQADEKKNDTGWNVYEESRRGGAIIAIGHDDHHGRQNLRLFSGFGGKEIHAQKLNNPGLVKIYTKTQGATYGALFGIFNVNGIPNKAMFYFKNIDGKIIDRFDVICDVHNSLTAVQRQPRQQEISKSQIKTNVR